MTTFAGCAPAPTIDKEHDMHPIANQYKTVPPRFNEGSATFAELQAAGFHRDEPAERMPGTPPVEELRVSGQQVIDPTSARTMLAESTFHVLRDPAGAIVATWDEGRWWTPEESDAFTAHIVAAMKAQR